jgi:hypothetical protein
MNILFGFVALFVGCLLIVFHKGFAWLTANDQYRLWRLTYSERLIKISEVMTIIVGIGFSVFGILALLGIVRFR